MNERYSRQILLSEIGPDGQSKLLKSSVLIVGCGALGCTLATILARAGVGTIRLVDRDLVEKNNLQRQILFDERDADGNMPKAVAAGRKLEAINSEICIDAQVADVSTRNIEGLVKDVSLVLDGTDNFETRYIINDACVKLGKPWIYGGAVGTTGMAMTIRPGEGPCLRCIFPDPPPPGIMPTCDTQGILGMVPVVVGSIQAVEACKILVGSTKVNRELVQFDPWNNNATSLPVQRADDCPACRKGRFDFLKEKKTSWVSALCGAKAIQITPARTASVPLEQLKESLARAGDVQYNGMLLRFSVDQHELVIFPDGRVIVKGTQDEKVAKGLVAKYVGV